MLTIIILGAVVLAVLGCGMALVVVAAGADARLARMTERDQHEEEKAL